MRALVVGIVLGLAHVSTAGADVDVEALRRPLADSLGPKNSFVPGKATVLGALTPDEVGAVIRRSWPDLLGCYESAGEREVVVVALLIAIDSNGAAQVSVMAGVESLSDGAGETSTLSPSFRRCLEEVGRSWRFPPPRGGGSVSVTYHLTFRDKPAELQRLDAVDGRRPCAMWWRAGRNLAPQLAPEARVALASCTPAVAERDPQAGRWTTIGAVFEGDEPPRVRVLDASDRDPAYERCLLNAAAGWARPDDVRSGEEVAIDIARTGTAPLPIASGLSLLARHRLGYCAGDAPLPPVHIAVRSDEDGRVVHARVAAAMFDSAVRECIEREARSWTMQSAGHRCVSVAFVPRTGSCVAPEERIRISGPLALQMRTSHGWTPKGPPQMDHFELSAKMPATLATTRGPLAHELCVQACPTIPLELHELPTTRVTFEFRLEGCAASSKSMLRCAYESEMRTESARTD